MSAETYTPTKGELIQVGPWNGVVVDVFESPTSGAKVFKILFAKNAFKQQPPELHELETLSMMGAGLRPSTQDRFDQEVEQYQRIVATRLEEIKALKLENIPA